LQSIPPTLHHIVLIPDKLKRIYDERPYNGEAEVPWQFIDEGALQGFEVLSMRVFGGRGGVVGGGCPEASAEDDD